MQIVWFFNLIKDILQGTCLFLDVSIEDLKMEKFILNGMKTPDDEWLILIYIKDNSPDKGIVIEDKSNQKKIFQMNINPVKYLKRLI